MTSEGLGELFEGDSEDTVTGKFPIVSMGAERRVLRAQTLERGPPSALAQILTTVYFFIVKHLNRQKLQGGKTFSTGQPKLYRKH